MNGKHKELQQTAIRWLYKRGCNVFAEEVPTWNGIADALGVKTDATDTVYYIEAKASRSDLLGKKQKFCCKRVDEVFKQGIYRDKKCFDYFKGMVKYEYPNNIDFFYFIIADGITIDQNLYPLWGVIDERGKVIRKAKRMSKKENSSNLIINIAHILVYKVFGKMYQMDL